MMHAFRSLNLSIVSSLHQGIRFPFSSYWRPESSKPCVISWPIITPTPCDFKHHRFLFTILELTSIIQISEEKKENKQNSFFLLKIYFGASLWKNGVCKIAAGKSENWTCVDCYLMLDVFLSSYLYDFSVDYRTHWQLSENSFPRTVDRQHCEVFESFL